MSMWTRTKRGLPWPERFAELAEYNRERWHGLEHTAEWKARMADLQRDFDAYQPTHPEPDVREHPASWLEIGLTVLAAAALAWLLVVVYVAQTTTDLSWVQLAQAAWTAVQP